jgi:hypothetical protein
MVRAQREKEIVRERERESKLGVPPTRRRKSEEWIPPPDLGPSVRGKKRGR